MTPQLAQLELRGYAPTVRVESRDELRVAVSDSVHVVEGAHIPSTAETFVPSLATLPDVLLQAAVVTLGDHTSEGHLIAGVAVAWFEIISQLKRDPEFLFKIHWRTLEELVAGAYERAGWPEVVLTPRSGDAGRDIIATRPGVGSIRIIDQVKAYRP
ncbi:MAG: restriction endonuclease, partial [Planctomycetes bacterium]|nr:restriction endonuclease [Planctomycetota bacterium]